MKSEFKGRSYTENEFNQNRNDLWEDDFDMDLFQKELKKFKIMAVGIFVVFLIVIIVWFFCFKK